eukprot:2381982-Rhodomonas_salina.1
MGACTAKSNARTRSPGPGCSAEEGGFSGSCELSSRHTCVHSLHVAVARETQQPTPLVQKRIHLLVASRPRSAARSYASTQLDAARG